MSNYPTLFVSGSEAPKRNPNDCIVSNAQNVFGRKFAIIPVSEIDIDMTYQREQTAQSIKKIISEWEDERCDPIKVSYRDGRFKAWDGSKRLKAQIMMGRTEVTCQICSERTLIEEATAFVHQTRNISPIRPADTYKANIARLEEIKNAHRDEKEELYNRYKQDLAEMKLDESIQRVVSEYDITIGSKGRQAGAKEINNVSKLRDIIKAIDEDGLRWVFDRVNQGTVP